MFSSVQKFSPEELSRFQTALVLFSSDPRVIDLWEETARLIVCDKMVRCDSPQSRIEVYQEGRPIATYRGPFTKEDLIEYSLARSAEVFRSTREQNPEHGISQYSSQFSVY